MTDLHVNHVDCHATPLAWIRLELLPLPTADVEERLLYWNPQTRELLGQGVEAVLGWIDDAVERGSVSGATLTHFEITDPLTKPSELAAILGQYYWVIPQPVEAPGLVNFVSDLPIQ